VNENVVLKNGVETLHNDGKITIIIAGKIIYKTY